MPDYCRFYTYKGKYESRETRILAYFAQWRYNRLQRYALSKIVVMVTFILEDTLNFELTFWMKNRRCHWDKDFCLISCPTVFYVIQEVRLVFFPTAILLVSLTNIIKGTIFDSINTQKNIIGFKRPRNSRLNNSLVKFPGIFESANPLKMEWFQIFREN